MKKSKYESLSTWEFSTVTPYINLLFRPKTFFCAWKFIFSVIKNFFILQLKQVLKITHIPVIKVDTDLDRKIPFIPEKVNTYLSFVSFFVKPLDMLIKRLGYRKAAPYMNTFLRYIAKAYKDAGSIYKKYLTTTERPNFQKKISFKVIHAADPHLLCVPSLHVSICVLTWSFYKELFETNILPEQEAQKRLSEIKQQSLAIIESVLFVKQHSVNCIPTALYMITTTHNLNFFSVQNATDFISNLFKESTEIDQDCKQEIIEYFNFMYEKTLIESFFDNNWQEPILNWIKDFAHKTGQL